MVYAAEHDVPIPYMQRTRDYYQRLGFPPYRWAQSRWRRPAWR
jgi:D-proline reductase (dithiol) PrdB